MKEIDARNLACPAPVLMTKQEIETKNPETVKIMVDNEAACQNVSRFLKSMCYEAAVEKVAGGFEVTGIRGKEKAHDGMQPAGQDNVAEKRIMIMITTDRMGYGDEALGRRLVANFINTLNEMGSDLWRLVLVNNGVRLAVEGSGVLESIQKLEADGVGVLVCGTCLDHYGLLEQKRAGETTNMLDIVTSMQISDQVINI